jgi:hypothetical protein
MAGNNHGTLLHKSHPCARLLSHPVPMPPDINHNSGAFLQSVSILLYQSNARTERVTVFFLLCRNVPEPCRNYLNNSASVFKNTHNPSHRSPRWTLPVMPRCAAIMPRWFAPHKKEEIIKRFGQISNNCDFFTGFILDLQRENTGMQDVNNTG